MIERRRLPACGRVADIALLGNSRGEMVRVRRALVILQVAGDTGRGAQLEISIRVALITLQLRVPTGEGKTHRIVIEIGRLPSRGRMAFLASLGNSERDVIRIAGLLEVG